ncbi:hypothetical protein A5625_14235 [Mycobacterium sp. 1465703.0]|nr:hypothetical protein A5625_14235 [Mycobacterium sp. 1465703.0]
MWALECAYWSEVDFNAAQAAPEYYTEDAVFEIGMPGARLQGRQAIAKFYAGRREAGARTTLHTVNNFTLLEWSTTSARTRSTVCLYGRDGDAPQESARPILMTDAETSYVVVAVGGWKVSSRVNRPVFVDSEHLPLERIRQIADNPT